MTDHRKSEYDPILRATNRAFLAVLVLIGGFILTVFLNAVIPVVGLPLLGAEALALIYLSIYRINRRRFK